LLASSVIRPLAEDGGKLVVFLRALLRAAERKNDNPAADNGHPERSEGTGQARQGFLTLRIPSLRIEASGSTQRPRKALSDLWLQAELQDVTRGSGDKTLPWPRRRTQTA
jgi:hypothetical protein